MTELKTIFFRIAAMITIMTSVFLLSCKKGKTETISIRGRITDQFSGKPLSGVSLEVFENCSASYGNWSGVTHTDARTLTDINGQYMIKAPVDQSDIDCNNWEIIARTSSNGQYLQKDLGIGSALQGTYDFKFYSYSTLTASASDTSGSPATASYIYISAPSSTYGYVNTPPVRKLPCVTSTVNTIICILTNGSNTDTLRKQIYCPDGVLSSIVFKY